MPDRGKGVKNTSAPGAAGLYRTGAAPKTQTMENVMPTLLDCRGLVCPEPVIRTRSLREKAPEDVEVLVDNAPASENVSRLLAKSGYAPRVERREEKLWAVCACKSGVSCAAAEEVIASAGEEAPRRTLVFLSSDVVGSGSDELGSRLMANFLATLPEMGANLWRIVMVNGGVRLASNPGPCLDALKKLESSGVSILVCGTCLDYFHLLEQKQVGETTNMLDIVTSLDLADKVIRV